MSDRLIKLILVDDDPIFQIGLAKALEDEQFSDLIVVSTSTNSGQALVAIQQENPDLVILELGLKATKKQLSGLEFCQEVYKKYPEIKICLLTGNATTEQILIAQKLGVQGYCPKGIAINELVNILRQIARGENDWLNADKLTKEPILKLNNKPPWLYNQCLSGLTQIENNLKVIDHKLRQSSLSPFDRIFWIGRYRELKTARWLVNQLLPVKIIEIPEDLSAIKEKIQTPADPTNIVPTNGVFSLSNIRNNSEVYLLIFQKILTKIYDSLENKTGLNLAIDILKPEKQQELLYLILNKIQINIEELKFLQINEEELWQKIPLVLKNLSQITTYEYFNKNYAQNYGQEVSNILLITLEDSELMNQEVLEKIPLVRDLFAYLVFEKALVIDNVSYRYESPEAIERAEILLDNLIIEMANSVMAIILNNFYELEVIKQNLFKQKFRGSRELAKFRNNLSWQYRQNKYVEEPQNIFEDKYRLFFIKEYSIQITFINLTRKDELNQLTGIRWLVTIVIELRDAIAPRLKILIDWIGKGLVYVLTEVIGKGIGLIGKGIVQGIGNSLQDKSIKKKP